MKKDTRRPSFTKTRAVTVYQPAVPLRAVAVYCDVVDGKPTFERDELFVMGVEVVVQDRYTHRPIPQTESDPTPETSRERDIKEAGYRLEATISGLADHQVLIWHDEYQCPVTLAEWEVSNARVIIGPRERPSEWWDKRFADAERGLTESLSRGFGLPANPSA
ncbi:hypothetical protein J0H58_21680 [bacterium]|nr:hypothetical protein [bacterium]